MTPPYPAFRAHCDHLFRDGSSWPLTLCRFYLELLPLSYPLQTPHIPSLQYVLLLVLQTVATFPPFIWQRASGALFSDTTTWAPQNRVTHRVTLPLFVHAWLVPVRIGRAGHSETDIVVAATGAVTPISIHLVAQDNIECEREHVTGCNEWGNTATYLGHDGKGGDLTCAVLHNYLLMV